MNLPPMGKLKLIKCEKINTKNNNKIPFTFIKKINTNRPSLKKRDLNKRNYSFKEIRNLSKNSESNKFIYTKHVERHNLEKNKNIKNDNIEPYKANNTNDSNLKFKKYLIDNLNKKNKFNHNFYESKSFSLLNKENTNKNIKSQNNLLFDCHTPNSNRIIFYKYSFNKSTNDNIKTIDNNISIVNTNNTNNNNFMINTSFNNNIYKYNNTLN